MTLRPERLALLLLVGLLATAAEAAIPAPHPADGTSAIPALRLQPTRLVGPEGAILPAESGVLTVPEDRARPGGRSIELAVLRVRSTATAPGPPLVVVAGGPGSSGIAMLRGPLFVFLPRLLALGDVVAFDQRGTGASRPALDCPETLAYPLDAVRTRNGYIALYRERLRACVAFWSGQGIDLGAYQTEASADDIDALRAALGAAKVNLLGGSYGSHLILSTIRRHGPRIGRAIITGTEGPDHTVKLPSSEQRQLEALARKVAADPTIGPLVPDFVGLVGRVLDRLGRQAVVAEAVDPATSKPVAVTLSRFDLQLVTAQGLGASPFLAQLPAAYYDMEKGDFSWLAAEIVARRSRPIESAMTLQMDCASGITAARKARIAREARETLLEDLIDLPVPDVCDAAVPRDLGDAFRSPIASNVPVLFLTGNIDGRTPPANADEIAAGFAGSARIVVDNAAHGIKDVLLTAPETRDQAIAFLQGRPVTITAAAIPPLRFARPRTGPAK
jgi:pimeloyl-ACP methyl ester carboxylesterase